VAFRDQNERHYVLDGARASSLLERLAAHLCPTPAYGLLVDRRFQHDLRHTFPVTELYYQDCDNVFEVMTATAPVLYLSSVEVGTILLLAIDMATKDSVRAVRMLPQLHRHERGLRPPVAV